MNIVNLKCIVDCALLTHNLTHLRFCLRSNLDYDHHTTIFWTPRIWKEDKMCHLLNSTRSSFMEKERNTGETGAHQLNMLHPPSFMKTHLPYQLWKKQLEKHPNLRVIQTIPNPLWSLFTTVIELVLFLVNSIEYFELFKRKKLSFGGLFWSKCWMVQIQWAQTKLSSSTISSTMKKWRQIQNLMS